MTWPKHRTSMKAPEDSDSYNNIHMKIDVCDALE